MKKYIIAICILGITSAAFAQKGDREDRREQMKALQIAFITEKLDLTPEESQNFWPVHNTHEQKASKIRSERRRSPNIEEMTDAQALAFVDEKISRDEMEVAARKEYVEDLKQVLPAKKIALLFMIEHDFKRKMLRSIKDNRIKKQKNK